MLHLPDGGVVAPEYAELTRRLQQGDGINWTGDPRMWLGIGVLENRRTGKTGRRLEVWRTNEDGTETLIAHWLPAEQHRILYDLANMRVDRPGHVSIEDRIDRHNDALQETLAQKAREEMFETLEHALKLDHDRNNPRTKFFMNGAPDRGARA